MYKRQGLDRAQFNRVAMIAQGEFLQLLLAKTEERSKIFRAIFHTEPYQKLQEEMCIRDRGSPFGHLGTSPDPN